MIFQQITSMAAIKNMHFVTKINNKMKFYFIWEDLVHFSTFSLNWPQHQQGVCNI